MERDSSINLFTVVTSSLIFEVLDHVVWEGKKSNYCSLFCIPTGPWDRPSKLKRSCTTIWQKGYTYFWLVAFSQQLGSHTVLTGVHMEEVLQWRKISKEVSSSSKQLKELVFCLWCGLTQQQNQALIHHLLMVHYKMCLVCPVVGTITPHIQINSINTLRMNMTRRMRPKLAKNTCSPNRMTR